MVKGNKKTNKGKIIRGSNGEGRPCKKSKPIRQ
ncbi:MAG: 30S ribosomal protein THX [Flavobacteriaceae bacterium]|nr:30S ribosomal protein THX [Flavobacteriaceae bacterium]